MRLFQPDTRQRRTMGALFIITCVVSILLTAFFQTQVVMGEQYALRSENNRLRPVNIPAPRGTIVDRYGQIVDPFGFSWSIGGPSRDSAASR